MKFRSTRNKILLYFGIAVFVFIILVPIYWLFLTALTPRTQLFSVPPNYFPDFTLQNFRNLIDQVPFLAYLTNSILFAFGAIILSVILSFLAAYGFARIEVPGSNFLLFALVLTMAIPEIVTVVPLFQVLRNLNMIDTIRGLVMVMGSVLVPFSVWVLVTFVKRVPVEMEEAAIVDGANLPQVLFYIVIPAMKPSLVTVTIINFINAWNNLLYPLVFSSSVRAKTLTVSITEIFQARTPYGRPWELISTLGVTMVVPMIILVFVAQRGIVSGLTSGSLD
ncbi:carbohydrate ABC transporter membrane protein 2 (CUT1 family) [Halanaerobium saccharolyticum]|uniref:Carbohydrate ABC transporter membrane protein 2 (CUT1 family) n=1 Tax=Halanaerobium saccharolyticum TaxID=43595 RepID=A0A4R7Z125_9FIRM|nr:carbohydrate ABC transporter permease [Halanaerobium saccharolyticum]RAK08159.1 carbohydrate ABC transporter membrane protein 2 (CUT1 family) [Halanaerobium saccharolyticum]TDW04366.1 carbohydrate ABC transporter membrane protein 2 (CUT1 family) [Halanaerobium saccharolyticum]TDX59657.1 carbohydrate ABC transporter membrane protein 2 (CUT1 family) [Halanaerobium saccharolyticum]